MRKLELRKTIHHSQHLVALLLLLLVINEFIKHLCREGMKLKVLQRPQGKVNTELHYVKIL